MGFNGGAGTLVSQELHANILQTERQVNGLSSYLVSSGHFLDDSVPRFRKPLDLFTK